MINFLQVTKSRLRRKVLSYYFTNPGQHLYVRQLASILNEDPGNLSKEFSMLIKEGIFIAEAKGNQKYFSLNQQYPLYKELKSIIFKTIGVVGQIKNIVEITEGIQLSFIYGSFAVNKEDGLSDVDLLIVGNPNEDELIKKIESVEQALGREINYNVYPVKEFKEKIEKKDGFIINILKRPKIILKGKIDGF